jgi:hypothetical protein
VSLDGLAVEIGLIWLDPTLTDASLLDGRQSFHKRAPGSRIRLDANAIIDG